ncbi:MAG: hypothetical protein OXG06_01200 [Gammaproteobacteria bacterium]|nr:hypothetical protein [Gammaproteobacteria bacterium]
METIKQKGSPLKSASVLLPAFILLCFQGSAASPDTSTEDFYIRTGAGIHWLDLQESGPFIRTNGREEVLGYLDHYDGKDDGALITLALGKAQNLQFTELRGFLTSHTSRHTREYDSDPAPWAEVRARFQDQHCPPGAVLGECLTSQTQRYLLDLIGDDPHVRTVGWVGRIDGAALPFGSAIFAWGDPIRIRTKQEVDFYGLDWVTGKRAEPADQSGASMYFGPSYKRLSQDIRTFAYESNRPATVNNLTLSEDLDASYMGGVIGTRRDFPLRPDWNFTVDGTLGLYYLDADYHGKQRTFISSGMFAIDEVTNHRTSDTQWAATVGLQALLAFSYSENVTLRFGAGIEYLSDVPTMRYARRGESLGPGDSHSPARIDYSDAFGYSSSVFLEFR